MIMMLPQSHARAFSVWFWYQKGFFFFFNAIESTLTCSTEDPRTFVAFASARIAADPTFVSAWAIAGAALVSGA